VGSYLEKVKVNGYVNGDKESLNFEMLLL